jgi:carboxymethylenebutenolidase
MGTWADVGAGGRGKRGTRAYIARPEVREGAGVLVLHAWWGLNDTFTGACDRLAAEGFIAVAPDLFGDGRIVTTVEEAEAQTEQAFGEAMLDRAEGGLDALLAERGLLGREVGVIGFSMGVPWALSLAERRPEIGAVVVFYGTGGGDLGKSDAAYLGHFVPGDELEPDAGVDALVGTLREAGRDVTIHRYAGTSHWFIEPDRPEYDAEAANLAWERTIAFLRENLGPIGA